MLWTSTNTTSCVEFSHSVLFYVFLPQVNHAYLYTICECKWYKGVTARAYHCVSVGWQLSIFCLHWISFKQLCIHCLLPGNRYILKNLIKFFSLLILWFTKFMAFLCFMRERGRRPKLNRWSYTFYPSCNDYDRCFPDSLFLHFSKFQSLKFI